MTLTRKLALKISDAVARHASPGAKEWAQGLAREVAFIPSDWSALAWALGSTRVLLDYREAPIGSLTEVPAAAQKFVESARNVASAGLVFPIFMVPQLLWEFFYARSSPERTGCALAVLCATSAGIFMLVELRRLKGQLSRNLYDDAVACALFYKAELERHLFSQLIALSVLFGWIVGVMLASHGGFYFPSFIGMAFGMVFVLFGLAVHARRVNRRRMERLDALLAEKS